MFTATMNFTMYITIALTGIYPMIQSMRDDVAFDAFEVYKNRWGGYEGFLFLIGLNTTLIALLIISRVMYGEWVQYFMLSMFFIVYG